MSYEEKQRIGSEAIRCLVRIGAFNLAKQTIKFLEQERKNDIAKHTIILDTTSYLEKQTPEETSPSEGKR